MHSRLVRTLVQVFLTYQSGALVLTGHCRSSSNSSIKAAVNEWDSEIEPYGPLLIQDTIYVTRALHHPSSEALFWSIDLP